MIRLNRKTFLRCLFDSIPDGATTTATDALETLAADMPKCKLADSISDGRGHVSFWDKLLCQFHFLREFRSGQTVFSVTHPELVGFPVLVSQACMLLRSEPRSDLSSDDNVTNGVVAFLVLAALSESEEDADLLMGHLRFHEDWGKRLLKAIEGFHMSVSGPEGMQPTHESAFLADFEKASARNDYVELSRLMAKLEWDRQLPSSTVLQTIALLLAAAKPAAFVDALTKKKHCEAALFLYWLPRCAKIAVARNSDSPKIWHEVLRQVGKSQRELSGAEVTEISSLIEQLGRSDAEYWSAFCEMMDRGWDLSSSLSEALGSALGRLGVEKLRIALDGLPILRCDEHRQACVARCIQLCITDADEGEAAAVLESCYRKWTILLKEEAEDSERIWTIDYTPLSGAVSAYWQTCRSREELLAECERVVGELEEIELRWFATGHAQDNWFLARLAKLYLLFHALYFGDPHNDLGRPQTLLDRAAKLLTDPRITTRYLYSDKALLSAQQLIAFATDS